MYLVYLVGVHGWVGRGGGVQARGVWLLELQEVVGCREWVNAYGCWGAGVVGVYGVVGIQRVGRWVAVVGV